MGRVSNARARLMDAIMELIWRGSYGSTTVDRICEKARVKKGSFYYFFDSKSDLAAAALAADWERRRPEYDALFSPTIPPLQRLDRFCDSAYQRQKEVRAKCGYVLGCPLFTFGAEVCTQEQKLRARIQGILVNYRTYLEVAIRDAHEAREVRVSNIPERARMIFAYYQGLLTQARIQNDADVLLEMRGGIFALLGLEPTFMAA